MYPEELCFPMRKELVESGFIELKNSNDVDSCFEKKHSTLLLFVNSVCGCAAANARPGAIQSLNHEKAPVNLTTVFAGVDQEATEAARNYMVPFPPSSPSIALFKNGELVHMLERHHIEGRPAELIAENLKNAYNEHC